MSEETLNNTTTSLTKAIEYIGSGLLNSEAQTKKSVIEPVLRGLGWNDNDPHEVVLEYSPPHSASGRVDYALLGPEGKPLVFVEAKKLEKADERGEEQLFQYAYGQGVPLLILTDGKTWNFYLSMVGGVTSERCFYRAVLTANNKTAEQARSFVEYLDRARVLSGEAEDAASKQLKNSRSKEKSKQAIPKAWSKLLEGPGLRSLLASAVESECGAQPAQDDMDDFLRQYLQTSPPPASRQPATSFARSTAAQPSAKSPRAIGYVFNGRSYRTGSSRRTLAAVLKEFARRDEQFMARFAVETDRTFSTKSKRLVAQSRDESVRGAELKAGIYYRLGKWLVAWDLYQHCSNGRIYRNRLPGCRRKIRLRINAYPALIPACADSVSRRSPGIQSGGVAGIN